MEDEMYGSSAESAASPSRASSTAATEPLSSTATTPPSSSRLSNGDDRAKEAQAFFSDFNNYLGIGCLIFREILADEDVPEKTQWREVTQLPLLSAFDGSVYGQVQSLSAAGWIKLLWSRSADDAQFQIYRVYVLPFDAGHRFVDRRSKTLSQALEGLLPMLDVSSSTWTGSYVHRDGASADKFDTWATREEGSLFYMFNKLPSPRPSPSAVPERYAREALEDLLDPESRVPGLKTALYPYQRQSAGLMLERESTTKLDLDPRLEERSAPDGASYYYSARDSTILRHPRYYEACKGGILSESMGAGKTVMCLALILATKKHFPKIPPRWNQPVSRSKTGSLASMAISSINRKSVPWQVEFERISAATGDDMSGCRQRLEAEPASYEVANEPQRWNRATVIPPPETITLAATTIVVVPHNLLRQWRSEISKHTDEGALSVLVMEDSKKLLPEPEQLRRYDIILFTRKRFELESKDGSDGQGRRMGTTQLLCRCPYIGGTRTRNCTCLRTDDLYDSPLKHLHFLRIIIDEGHFFSNNGGIAASVAEKLLKVDHRWVVSGTPAKDLLGVEVDTSSAENLWQNPATAHSREAVLEQRRHFSDLDKTGAIKSLGSLASAFLKIRPWAAASNETNEAKADWEEYVFRHEGFRSRKARTFSGFSSSLRRTLEAMVIKTRPEDVEKDIDMPPLTHKIVRLEPSLYDKLTANLFTLVLTANAVTSERTDQDYLFHKNSAKARYQLVANLRQSAFFWTGFSEDDIESSIRRSRQYLEKDETTCSPDDRALLIKCLKTAETVLNLDGWKAMSRSHELGLFVRKWPHESWAWAFDAKRKTILTGISHLLQAQRHVHDRLATGNPGGGLAGAGVKALLDTKPKPKPDAKGKGAEETADNKKESLNKAGIPTSSLDGEPSLKRKLSSGLSPSKKPSRAFKVTKASKGDTTKGTSKTAEKVAKVCSSSPALPDVGSSEAPRIDELPPDSPFLQSRIVGTTSSKLSYLASEILRYYQEEKILVFYDGDNAAYYIAQMLDLLHIRHEIYAKSLKASQKSEYAVRFDQETQDRVLLMDVRQAAFGLNLPAASRIYFVNPVCRENIEAQAIKRAHRIGQTKAVHVETLVLKGTIEEKMLDRSKRMTRAEHLNASHLEDDGGIKEIIQSAAPLDIDPASLKLGEPQMAPLHVPQQIWCRSSWREYQLATARGQGKKRKALSDVDDADDPVANPQKKKKSGRRRTLAFVDCRTDNPTEISAQTTAGASGASIDRGASSLTEASPASDAASNSTSKDSRRDDASSRPNMTGGDPTAPPYSPLGPVGGDIPGVSSSAADQRAVAHTMPELFTTETSDAAMRTTRQGIPISALLRGDERQHTHEGAAYDDVMQGILQRL